MLKELRLNNIVLVESATVIFTEGFNVLSGESGSGKSAIMNALNLIAGERSDTSSLRRGADKGSVEAVFDITGMEHLRALLEESGIEHEEAGELFIRRDLSTTGKSRAFINNQLAQLSLLKKVSDHLFDVIGQHANQKLLSLDYHRLALDLYGDLQGQVKDFTECWEEENRIRGQLVELVNSEAQRMRELEVCRMEAEEIQEANIKEGEEEELFEEYTALSNADELAEKSSEISRLLFGEKLPVLALLSKQKSTFEQLAKLAPVLSEAANSFNDALLELNEVAHTLRNFESHIEHNPERAAQLNERLELITRIKRKFGPSVEEVRSYQKKIEQRLSELEGADSRIEDLQTQLKKLESKTNDLGSKLTKMRQQAAIALQKDIVDHLKALNMPKVEFHIDISPIKRMRSGDDKVEFYLTPNVGEHRISLRECASGGELSRTMLALQAVLAGKENTPTLIFDEIDANIGGATASVVGEKMHEISRMHQVLCITHFPQVARQANHHLRIFKQEVEGRTFTVVENLDEGSRHHELARMAGET